jgi:hypothetical protein
VNTQIQSLPSRRERWRERQRGKIGYILLWLLGVPIPLLFLFYLLRGCN